MTFRRLLCYIGWHRQGEPKDFRGASDTTECKDCGMRTLNIRVTFEEDITKLEKKW